MPVPTGRARCQSARVQKVPAGAGTRRPAPCTLCTKHQHACTRCTSAPLHAQESVVILLLPPLHRDVLVFEIGRPPGDGRLTPRRARVAGGVAPVVAAADLLLRAEGFEREVDAPTRGRRSDGPTWPMLDAASCRPPTSRRPIDQLVRRRRIAQLQRCRRCRTSAPPGARRDRGNSRRTRSGPRPG